jgi:hypothetical protein
VFVSVVCPITCTLPLPGSVTITADPTGITVDAATVEGAAAACACIGGHTTCNATSSLVARYVTHSCIAPGPPMSPLFCSRQYVPIISPSDALLMKGSLYSPFDSDGWRRIITGARTPPHKAVVMACIELVYIKVMCELPDGWLTATLPSRMMV